MTDKFNIVSSLPLHQYKLGYGPEYICAPYFVINQSQYAYKYFKKLSVLVQVAPSQVLHETVFVHSVFSDYVCGFSKGADILLLLTGN